MRTLIISLLTLFSVSLFAQVDSVEIVTPDGFTAQYNPDTTILLILFDGSDTTYYKMTLGVAKGYFAPTLSLSGDSVFVAGTYAFSIAAYDESQALIDTASAIRADFPTNTDAQTLSFSSPNLTISGGNSVNLSALDTDTQLSQEQVEDFIAGLLVAGSNVTITYNDAGGTLTIAATDTDDQTLSLAANNLTISEGNSVSLASYLDNTDDQTLSLAGDTLSIESGNSVILSGLGGGTDTSGTNYSLNLAGTTLQLTDQGGTLTQDLSSLQDGTGTDDQNLSVGAGSATSSIIEIENGNDVTLQAGANITITEAGSTITIAASSGTATVGDGDYGDITVSASGTVWSVDDGVIGPTELASTAVTPGSYTFSSITVDADGRITAASNGSEVDGSVTNEIQQVDTFDLSGTTLRLSLSQDGEALKTVDLASIDTDTQLSEEQVEDFVGGMVTGNTETLISVTYQDADGTIDFEVTPTLSSYTNDAGFLTAEVDGSTTNELQDFDVTTLSGTDLQLSLTQDATTHTVDLSSLKDARDTVVFMGMGSSFFHNATDSTYYAAPELYEYSEDVFAYDQRRDSIGVLIESEYLPQAAGRPLNAPPQSIGALDGQVIDRVNSNLTFVNKVVFEYKKRNPEAVIFLLTASKGATKFAAFANNVDNLRDSIGAVIDEAIAANPVYNHIDYILIGAGQGEVDTLEQDWINFKVWLEQTKGVADQRTTYFFSDATQLNEAYNRYVHQLASRYDQVKTGFAYADSMYNDFDSTHASVYEIFDAGKSYYRSLFEGQDAPAFANTSWKIRYQQPVTSSEHGYVLKYDTTTNEVFLQADATGGAGSFTVEEADGTPTVTATTLQFDQADGLTVTDEGGGQVQIDLANVPVSAMAFDPILETELDSEAELEAQLTDVTNVFTNNDGALSDDDLSDNTTTDLAEGTNLYYTDERVDDRVNALIVDGANITTSYDDIANTLTIASTDTQLSEEQVEDFVGGMVTGNTESLITVTYQDADGTLDFGVEPNLSNYTNDAGFLTANQSITLSGDVTGTGTTAITTSIASGVVGPDELASTAVTPGSYTNANITVDADGRLTAASNGSAGGGGGGSTEYYFVGHSNQNTDTSLTSLDTWYDIRWSTEIEKDLSFTHSTTVNGEEITIDSAGTYHFNFTVNFDPNGTIRSDLYAAVFKDTGAGYNIVPQLIGNNSTAPFSSITLGFVSLNGGGTVALNAGDKVKLAAYVDVIGSGAGPVQFYDGINMTITRIK